MPKFKPGKSGNPGGRPKGTSNKSAAELRGHVSRLWSDLYDQVLQDIRQLKPRERVQALVALTEYVLPKLQRQETVVDVSKMTAAEIDTLVQKIIEATPDE